MPNPYRAGYPEKKAVVVPHYGAGVVTNPKMLPAVIAASHQFINSSATPVLLQNGVPPDHGSLAITGTTEVNLFSVSGSGFLYDIITPNGDPLVAPNATVTIVVDGVPTVINTTGGIGAGFRLLVGATADINGANPRVLSFIGKHPQSFYVQVPTVYEVDSKAMPRLRFERSLSVNMRMSATPQALGTDGNKAMWRYRLD
jgi:hypothetical protein